MRKYMPAIIISLIVSLISLALLYFTEYSTERFVIKGALFLCLLIVYVIALFCMRTEHIVYSLIFLSFFDIQIKQFYTTSTNVIILIALGVLWIRQILSGNVEGMFTKIKNSSVTLPLVLLLCSYTLSLFFAEKEMGIQLMMYHSIICVSILVWMIVATVNNEGRLREVNKIMLMVLLINLLFSVLFQLFPGIDMVRAQFFSLFKFAEESATRIQGLSFRGEGYAEYLMICATWLFVMLLSGQLRRAELFLWFVAVSTISIMIMTRSRGANLVFFAGMVFFLITSKSVQMSKKVASLVVMVLVCAATILALKAYSQEVTLFDRFHELTDKSQMVGYVPETRYYTWLPAWNDARRHYFMGVGPSFEPVVTTLNWRDIVADNVSGDVLDWPHNIILLVLSTVGFIGLLNYLFLVYRTVRLRKVFGKLGLYLRSCYYGYLLCFVLFLFEGQKFDGFLRHPDTNFYFIFILVALLFSCENMVRDDRKTENECLSYQPEPASMQKGYYR